MDLLRRSRMSERKSSDTLLFEIYFFIYAVMFLMVQWYNIYRWNMIHSNLYILMIMLLVLVLRPVISAVLLIQSMHSVDLAPAYTLTICLSICCYIVSITHMVVYSINHKIVTWWSLLYIVVPLMLSYFYHRLSVGTFSRSHPSSNRSSSSSSSSLSSSSPARDSGPGGGSASGTSANTQSTVLSARLTSLVVDLFQQSFIICYIISVLPLIFISNSFIYVDYVKTTITCVYIFFSCVTLLSSRMLNANFIRFYAQTKALGAWVPVQITSDAAKGVPNWEPRKQWARNSLVKYNNVYYRGQSDCNTAEPGIVAPSILHFLFGNNRPYTAYTILFIIISVLLSFSTAMIFISAHWLSYAAMACVNYPVVAIIYRHKQSNAGQLAALSQGIHHHHQPSK